MRIVAKKKNKKRKISDQPVGYTMNDNIIDRCTN